MRSLFGILASVFIAYVGVSLAKQYYLIKEIIVKVKDFDIIKLTLKNAKIRLHLHIINPSDLDILISYYDITAFINGVSVARFKNKTKKLIKPKNYVVLPLDIEFEPRKVANVAIQKDFISGLLLDKRRIRIALKGLFTLSHKFIKIKKFPLDYQASLFELQEDSETQKT